MNKKIFKIYVIIFVLLSTSFISAQKNNHEPKQYFDGFYLGSSIGSQNIFGGALINNTDVLTQKSGFVLELNAGFRKQFLDDRFIVGAEFSYGFTDGNLLELNFIPGYEINYENKYQTGYGLSFGIALGANNNYLVYTYAIVTKRFFDIKIKDNTGLIFTQEDGQRFIRYGIGFEAPIYNNFHAKVSIGGVFTDYEGLIITQNVDDKLDFTFGVNYQF